MTLDFRRRTAAAPTNHTFPHVAGELLKHGESVIRELLPMAEKRGQEFVVGSLQGERGESLSINAATGIWKEFGAGGVGGGDLVALWAAVRGIGQGEAKREAETWLGISADSHASERGQFTANHRGDRQSGVTGEANDNVPKEPRERPSRKADKIWSYPEADGTLAAQVYRYDEPDGKQIWPFNPNTPNGAGEWKHLDRDDRPLYRLPDIIAYRSTIVVVAGEKCCDAIAELGLLGTTNMGGESAIDRTDWTPLAGKDVVLWRDNDGAGLKWQDNLQAILKDVGVASLRIVTIPAGKPSKFDSADATLEERQALIAEALASRPVFRGKTPLVLADLGADDFQPGAAPDLSVLVSGTFALGVPIVLAAEGGIGKGLLTLDLALKVAQPKPQGMNFKPPVAFGGDVVQHGTVVILSAEDDRGEIHRRLDSLDHDGSRRRAAGKRLKVVCYPDRGGAPALFESDRDGTHETDAWSDIRRQIDDIDDLRLVVVDPIASFARIDGDVDSQAVTQVMGAFGALAIDKGAAVIVTHHVSKAGRQEADSLQAAAGAVKGSAAWVNAARIVFSLYVPPEDKARAICETLGIQYAHGVVVRGGLSKTNLRLSKGERTFLRNPATGLLEDRTDRLASAQRGGADDAAWLIAGIKDAVAQGHPYAATGNDGLFAHKTDLPHQLHDRSKHDLETLVRRLVEAKLVRKCVAKGSTSAKWLDVPDGPLSQSRHPAETDATVLDPAPYELAKGARKPFEMAHA